ncbi:MAG: hypothetical protein AAB407_01955 [Patescibacteria group bacterium]
MQVIPAINAASYEEAKEHLQKIARTGAQMIHIDIVDGKFAPNVTWGSPEELNRLFAEIGFHPNFELHLMTENTERSLETWCSVHPHRVIVHAEGLSDVRFAANACNGCDAELMIAIRPGTPVEVLMSFGEMTNAFQVLAVDPGKAGQKFQEGVIHKIETLRKQYPGAIIEVDGGITPDIARRCKSAGANNFVSASFIMNHSDPKVAYETLLATIG